MSNPLSTIDGLINKIDETIPAKGVDKQPYTTLVTGDTQTKMPLFGLGTWKSIPESKVTDAVNCAIRIGYRHIDCALVYGNEKGVGKAIKECIQDGIVKREDLFVVTKLWNTYHRMCIEGVKESLKNLGLDYVDLYLIHWPQCYKKGTELFPKGANGKMIYDNVSIVETWKGMEECVKQGYTKHIGLSNFNVKQVNEILQNCTIKPVANQLERTPYLPIKALKDCCDQNNIIVTAYAPLGSGDRPFNNQHYPILMRDRKLINLANKKGVPVSKILLRWALQTGTSVIPKSTTPSRIRSNIEIFDFELDNDDLAVLNSMENGLRYCVMTDTDDNGNIIHRDGTHPDYPVPNEKIWQVNESVKTKTETKDDVKDDAGDEVVVRVKYFPMGGRASSIRQAAYIGGVKLEDEFMTQETWGAYKAADKPKWSGVPEVVITKNGKTAVFSQSNSLTRYVGKLSGLYPKNDIDALKVDEYMDAMEDFINLLVPTFREQDETKRIKMRQDMIADKTSKGLPYWLNRFELRLKENEDEGFTKGYFVGNSLTIADLKVVSLLVGIPAGRLDGIPKNYLENFPKLNKLLSIVNDDPKIVEFAKKFMANVAAFGKDKTKNIYSY